MLPISKKESSDLLACLNKKLHEDILPRMSCKENNENLYVLWSLYRIANKDWKWTICINFYHFTRADIQGLDSDSDYKMTSPESSRASSYFYSLHDFVRAWLLKEAVLIFNEHNEKTDSLKELDRKIISLSILNKKGYNQFWICQEWTKIAWNSVTIDLKFVLDFWKIEDFFSMCIDAFKENKILAYNINLLSYQKHVHFLANLISKWLDDYWRNTLIINKTDFPLGMDYFIVLFSFERLGFISFLSDPSARLIPSNVIPKRFKIQVINQEWIRAILSDNQEDREVEKNSSFGLIFKKDAGQVFIDWEYLGDISRWTQQFLFFEFLYDHAWSYKTHKEIVEYIQKKWKTIDAKTIGQAEISAFCSNLKNKIDKNIRCLIKSSKWEYSLTQKLKVGKMAWARKKR